MCLTAFPKGWRFILYSCGSLLSMVFFMWCIRSLLESGGIYFQISILLKRAWLVILHDLRIRKSQPAKLKYNAAQRVAYSMIIVMGLGSMITGFAIYKPVQLQWLTNICGGYETARIEHFILTLGYVLFFVIHIIQVLFAGWNNFRSMVAGFEVIKDETQPNQ
jgi:thiosulfate reductase cytochrome b subunit